ncbi:hypothetical protein ACVCNR_22280 (plasmid) [Aquamicrobium terrae]
MNEARAAVKPTGLAAFLGRVTGVAFVIAKIHKHREKTALVERQRDDVAQGRLEAPLSQAGKN